MSSTTITLPIYQQKQGPQLTWTTLGLGERNQSLEGRSAVKLQRKLVDRLRKIIEGLPAAELEHFASVRGARLERVRMELTLKGAPGRRQLAGLYPLVIEPRWISDDEQILVVYHPLRQAEWFPVADPALVPELAPHFFRHAWADVVDVDGLASNAKDLLRTVSLSARARRPIDELRKEEDDKKRRNRREPEAVLARIGSDESARAIDGGLALGMPRSPYREQLQHLLGGSRRRPVIVVGPPGVGKTTIVNRWIDDRLIEDEFEVHRNLDRIHNVWRVSGKRIIAGMAYLGDWEQRCIDLLTEVKKRRAILVCEDLHLFGRLGQTRDSERSLADFFRGPVARGELILIGECNAEQLQRLEDDAPAFAALFTRVHLQPTSASETLQMVVHAARTLEREHYCAFHPYTFRSILEIGGSLFPWSAFPGKALDILRKLADRHGTGDRRAGRPTPIEPSHVLDLLSQQTGLPENLLTLSARLDVDSVAESFSRYVMGQPGAIAATCDLVFKIRAGLTDPHRPYAVNLFTGPTGTGKTELATCIAIYLFGDTSRLVRFDMSEFSSPDGVARLIGDRWNPKGQLTQKIREQPFAVVLFDEVEKAHPAVLNLLLQLFDEGRLTDAAGDTASFHHTVVIMTSNLGARPTRPIGFGDSTAGMVEDIARAVREFFPPELFNRIDRVIPFHPLTESVAEQIVAKELAALLGRRGLRERNIFVYANAAVKRRIVAEAFDPRHGARTVKRYLEDRIGSLLAEQIASSGRATMQVVRIYESAGEFRLHVEPLTERDPEVCHWALAPLIDLPALRLSDHLPEVREVVDAALEPARLDSITRAVRAHAEAHELRYFHDVYVARLRELRDWLDNQGVRRRPADAELIEATLFARGDKPIDCGRARRRFDPRAMQPRAVKASKIDLLRAIADAYHLTRVGPLLADPTRHVAWVELLRMGQGEQSQRFASGSRGLFEWMCSAYADPELSEEIAVRHRDGTIIHAHGEACLATLDAALARRPAQVVLKLSGLAIYEALAGEHGCHIWSSLAAEPEIVRVRVIAGESGGDARQRIRAHLDQLVEFEAAMERGQHPLPANPEQLIPTVRTLCFQPPLRPGEVFSVEVEDFLLASAEQLHLRSLADLVERLSLLRRSRIVEACNG